MYTPTNTKTHLLLFKISRFFTHKHSNINTSYCIKKADILHYYRTYNQSFLNLGSLLISETDGWLFIFNDKGELIGIDKIHILKQKRSIGN